MDNFSLSLHKFNLFDEMLSNFGLKIYLKSQTKNPFFSIFKPQTLTLTKTLAMATNSSPNNRRPTCPLCSRPSRVCLCTRFKTPVLENTIAVTLLQHSLEKKHPLNSAKIATLGLKNINLAYVSDVISEAHFNLRLLNPNLHLGVHDSFENSEKIESLQVPDISFSIDKKGGITKFLNNLNQTHDCNQVLVDKSDLGVCELVENRKKIDSLRLKKGGISSFEHNLNQSQDLDKLFVDKSDLGPHDSVENCEKIESLQSKKGGISSFELNLNQSQAFNQLFVDNSDLGPHDSVENCKKIESLQPKKGVIASIEHNLNQNQDFDRLLCDKSTIECIRNGFIVKKIGKGNDGKYVQEYEIEVPKGSVLLFPSENSIGIKDIDFDVKNLIVLDGTWGKATRMYNENLWLKLLPHLKLDIGKLSLYGEVRRQPKARCLSSIESIVYALKAIGEDVEGLDSLLDVFESMVGDQRRCKNERLEFESNITSM